MLSTDTVTTSLLDPWSGGLEGRSLDLRRTIPVSTLHNSVMRGKVRDIVVWETVRTLSTRFRHLPPSEQLEKVQAEMDRLIAEKKELRHLACRVASVVRVVPEEHWVRAGLNEFRRAVGDPLSSLSG